MVFQHFHCVDESEDQLLQPSEMPCLVEAEETVTVKVSKLEALCKKIHFLSGRKGLSEVVCLH